MNDTDETKLILEACEVWETQKHITRDVSRAISRHCGGMNKETREAVKEAGRAAFVLGYLARK